MRQVLGAFVLVMAIAGCVTRHVPVCPALRDYSPAFQARLADELQEVDEGSALVQAMIDYARLRARIRACAAS